MTDCAWSLPTPCLSTWCALLPQLQRRRIAQLQDAWAYFQNFAAESHSRKGNVAVLVPGFFLYTSSQQQVFGEISVAMLTFESNHACRFAKCFFLIFDVVPPVFHPFYYPPFPFSCFSLSFGTLLTSGCKTNQGWPENGHWPLVWIKVHVCGAARQRSTL